MAWRGSISGMWHILNINVHGGISAAIINVNGKAAASLK